MSSIVNQLISLHDIPDHLPLCVVLIKHHTYIGDEMQEEPEVEEEPQEVEPKFPNNETQGRPLCIPMLFQMHNELWLSIASICYYKTRSTKSNLFELSYLDDATTLNLA